MKVQELIDGIADGTVSAIEIPVFCGDNNFADMDIAELCDTLYVECLAANNNESANRLEYAYNYMCKRYGMDNKFEFLDRKNQEPEAQQKEQATPKEQQPEPQQKADNSPQEQQPVAQQGEQNQQNKIMSTRGKGRPKKPFKDMMIIDDADGSKLKKLHQKMQGKTGKSAALVIYAAMKKTWISKPTHTQITEEFGDIGAQQGFTRYLNDYSFTPEELTGMMNSLD